ncbi:MAG: hypothetical protein OFPI_43230 [Osedax symbiont Rs2]|nr:MAG: hypothetical protein OFPI_43230 [Osedax symbiont Rs2]
MKIDTLSHITLVVSDIERMTVFLCEGLGAREVFDNNDLNLAVAREKFFVVGDTWLAAIVESRQLNVPISMSLLKSAQMICPTLSLDCGQSGCR